MQILPKTKLRPLRKVSGFMSKNSTSDSGNCKKPGVQGLEERFRVSGTEKTSTIQPEP